MRAMIPGGATVLAGAKGDESGANGGPLAQPYIEWREEPGEGGAWGVEHCAADLLDPQPSLHCCAAQLPCRMEAGCPPQWCTKPAANAPSRRPEVPSPKFANHQPSTGSQHASHLAPGTCLVPDKAKHRHGCDEVEALGVEWERLNPAIDEIEMQLRSIRARTRSAQHSRVRIQTDHMAACACEIHGERAVTATDVENI